MGKLKKNRSQEKKETTAVKTGMKANPYLVAITAAVVVVGIIVLLTVLAVNSYNRNKALSAELAAAADELERQKKLAEDLEKYSSEQESKLDELQEKVDELLNIQEAEPVITSARIQEQLRAVSELVTQQYIYTNADRGEYNKTWLWGWDMPFSDKSLLVKYDGTIKAGIDLSDVQVDVNEDTRTVTVTLPGSKVTDNNVPQNTILVYETRDGLFNKVTIDDSNALISKGKEAMEAKAIERGLLDEADKQAQTLIRTFLTMMPGMDSYKLEIK